MVDVDTGYMKAVLVPSKTVSDFLIEGATRIIEQLFRRRMRLRCDGEPVTTSLAASPKTMVFDLVTPDAGKKRGARSAGHVAVD